MAGKASDYWEKHRSTLERLVTQERMTAQEIADSGLIPGATISTINNAKQRFGLTNGRAPRERPTPAADAKPFDAPDLPSPTIDLTELLRRRKMDFDRKHEAKQARRLIPIRVRVDGPFGVAHFGDPHVDDPGSDIALLERHMAVVQRTEAMFAGNVGDYQNNWIGRLARLHAQQSVTTKESWLLVEWLVRASDWIYLVGGNHDAWTGDSDPLRWITDQTAALLEPSGVRLELQTPSGRHFRVNARHDFPGRSMWNIAHGPGRAVQMGWRDHVLSCGHLHASGHMHLKDPASGLITHAFRVASYKTYDSHAEERGFPDARIFVCPVTIFNPAFADDDPRCVTFLPDPEEAAEYLTWMRGKQKGSGRAA